MKILQLSSAIFALLAAASFAEKPAASPSPTPKATPTSVLSKHGRKTPAKATPSPASEDPLPSDAAMTPDDTTGPTPVQPATIQLPAIASHAAPVPAVTKAAASVAQVRTTQAPVIAPSETTVTGAATHTEPFPARVTGDIPPGWEITLMPDEEITHGPFELPDGSKVSFTTPGYQLSPIVLEGSVYLIEPGYDVNRSDPREGTLCAVLARQMESLRSTAEGLKAISRDIKQLEALVLKESKRQGTR